MDVSPDALYSDLLLDLRTYISPDLLQVYLERSDFPVGCSSKVVSSISIARSFLKKFRTANTDKQDSRALLKFLQINKDCEDWSLRLDSSLDEMLFGELKNLLNDFWFKDGFDLVGHHYDLLKVGNLGPGATINGGGGDFYTKMFDSPLSHTEGSLYFWYNRYVSHFPTWSEAEKLRTISRGTRVVRGNRLSFVPKNDKISRTICSEPTLNLFYQLGFAEHLNRRLRDFSGISLTSHQPNGLSLFSFKGDLPNDQQPKNRYLARVGSRTNRFATIDLESASDSMSLKMLEAVLPSSFLNWLNRLRSQETFIPGIGYTSTSMVSTMGNGSTFSLQTVLFTCVVLAAFRVKEIKILYPRGQCWGNFGVNGDDIVVPSEVTDYTLRLLKILGFKTNDQKTFLEGPFRESCGGDYYHGFAVRGVYAKALDTQQARYSLINQLCRFCSRTGLLLTHTVTRLRKSVRWQPVPRWESDDSGLQMPLFLAKPPMDKNGSFLYSKWVDQTKKIRISDSAIVSPRGSRLRSFNPPGLILSFLRGDVNEYSIGVRSNAGEHRYARRRGIAPWWDEDPYNCASRGTDVVDERWKTATLTLLA